METIVADITCNPKEDEKIYEKAGEILRAGGLVAFPTETVYGLGADALDEAASAKIYAAKGRPSDNPLIVHIADMDAVYKLASEVPEAAVKLADKFWPGPLTMILKKSDIKTVAVTVSPDEEQILKIQDKGFDYVQIHGELRAMTYVNA